MLQGFRRYLSSQLPNQLLRPLFLGGFVVVLVLLHRQLTPAGVMLANLAATLVALGFTLRPLREARPAPARQVARVYDHADWRRTVRGLLVVAIAQFVISQQSDVLVVGTLLGTSESAVYGAAGQLTTLISFGITSVSFVATPLIAAAYARGAPEELQRLIRVINRINIAVCVPLVLGIILIGKWLLAVVFGSAFVSAYPVLVILSCAQLVVGLIGTLAGFLLTMTSHQRAAGWIIGGSAVFNLVLTLILTPRFGVIGTATATLLAASARSIVLAVYIRARMGLQLLVV
jgi:O-antigen/teichoic acid export membrane protein